MDSSNSNKLLPPGAVIRPFEMRVLGKEGRPTYQSIKKQFSAESVGNPKDSRFLLSDMVHSHLSVEVDEERRFRERLELEIQRIRETIQTEAHKEGYENGLVEGRDLAHAEEKSRLAAMIEGMSHVISSMAEAKQQLAADYEDRVVALAYRMASVVVDHQVRTQPELVSHSIRAILEKIAQDEDIRIRLSSEDHGIVGQLESELKTVSHKGRISFDLDTNIKRGDCIIEAGSGEIASFIDEKLNGLRAELEKVYPEVFADKKTGT